MEDSFFGFDTSAPLGEDGGGRIAEPSEEEYDALNDETFGSAINGDWEEAHESLVRMTDRNDTGNVECKEARSFMTKNSAEDLDLNLAGMKLDDVDINFDDSESNGSSVAGLKVDSSVWGGNNTLSQNILPIPHGQGNIFAMSNNMVGANLNPEHFLRQNFPLPFQQHHSLGGEKNGIGHSHPMLSSPKLSKSNTPKICTLEDIERNLMEQSAIQKPRQQKMVAPSQKVLNEDSVGLHNLQQSELSQQQQVKAPTSHQSQKLTSHQKAPPVFGPGHTRTLNNFSNNMAQHPLGNLLQQPPITGTSRLPPGLTLPVPLPGHTQLPPHSFLNQHGMPLNFAYPVCQSSMNSSHLPVALNNFAMHPNFNAMRAVAAGIHPTIQPSQQSLRMPNFPLNTAAVLNNQQPNSMFNMFNTRLVQEIQQNHPMLQNAVRQSNGFQPHSHLHQQQQQQQRNGLGMKQNIHRSANGNLPGEEIDDYANLMSTRDKHWLISIQLSQLNTDTPYIDDYYYTMYKEKKATTSGVWRHSQAHKDNQLNHPLTQPKGHAQLILVQLGNKNGVRNGQHRERRASESGNNLTNMAGSLDQKTPYVFTPLKFENSLGKLQYGSVTAPRKIIDAEIMGGEMGFSTSESTGVSITNNKTTSFPTIVQHKNVFSNITLSAGANTLCDMTQRKSRHILLHIETLYRIVLKLEDLGNPNAIETIIMKKKKESERMAALEQLENANKTPEERSAEVQNPQLTKNKFAYEIEPKDVLVEKLIAGLTLEKIISMMNVRKGKILIRRILPFLIESDFRWQVWIGVFASLQSIMKKDRDDIDGILYALYPVLKQQIKQADFETVVKLCKSIPTSEKKSSSVFCSKFGIAALVCLIIRAEELFIEANSDVSASHKCDWRQFLDDVATSLNRTIQNQTICAAIESDCIQPMMNHFARFKDLKLDSLSALITEAKQQIN